MGIIFSEESASFIDFVCSSNNINADNFLDARKMNMDHLQYIIDRLTAEPIADMRLCFRICKKPVF